MEFDHPSVFERRWDRKEITLLACLVVLPNLLGLLNIDTGLGFKIHVFQLGIVIAALFYGMSGGLLAGTFGSIYSAIIINNPYIIIGNAILGLAAGYLIARGHHTVLAVWIGSETVRESKSLVILFFYSFPSEFLVGLVPHEPILLYYGKYFPPLIVALVSVAGTVLAEMFNYSVFSYFTDTEHYRRFRGKNRRCDRACGRAPQ